MTDRALVDGVETAWVDCIIESALQAIRPHAAVETIQIFGVIALDWAGKEICLVAIADTPARDARAPTPPVPPRFIDSWRNGRWT